MMCPFVESWGGATSLISTRGRLSDRGVGSENVRDEVESDLAANEDVDEIVGFREIEGSRIPRAEVIDKDEGACVGGEPAEPLPSTVKCSLRVISPKAPDSTVDAVSFPLPFALRESRGGDGHKLAFSLSVEPCEGSSNGVVAW